MGQFGQRMTQVDLILQARAEQLVGVGSGTFGGNGALAHAVVRDCKKTAPSVAKSCSSNTPLQARNHNTSPIVWVLQGRLNTLEFHPWGAHAEQPDLADRIVFDLDPGPDVAWTEVVAAARQVRTLLSGIGLQSWVRTTGGKGLHVVAPLAPALDWAEVKPFAHAFASSMAEQDPLRFVASASKRLRKGRIFIDYLRNGRGATSIASFSLRARAGAPVAMPLRWEELGRVKAGNAFDIHNAPRRLARLKAHPWDGIGTVRQGLPRFG